MNKKLLILLIFLLLAGFGGSKYIEYLRSEQNKLAEEYEAYYTGSVLDQLFCATSDQDKRKLILSMIEGVNRSNAMLIKERYRELIALQEKYDNGSLTIRDKLNLSNTDFITFNRHFRDGVGEVDSLFEKPKLNWLSKNILVQFEFNRTDDSIIIYDDGYTRWVAKTPDWRMLVKRRMSELEQENKLRSEVARLRQLHQDRSVVAAKAEKVLSGVTQSELEDFYKAQKQLGHLNNPRIDFDSFVYKPESLPQYQSEAALSILSKLLVRDEYCSATPKMPSLEVMEERFKLIIEKQRAQELVDEFHRFILETVPSAQYVRTEAEEGKREAQVILGIHYQYGTGGLPKDYVLSYMWYSIAATQGSEDAVGLKELLMKQLNTQQINQGDKMTNDWLKQKTHKQT